MNATAGQAELKRPVNYIFVDYENVHALDLSLDGPKTLIVLLRVTGKRQIGQMAPFDLVLLLVLSNAVQNAMNGGDNSVTAGVISAVTLVGVNFMIGFATFKSKRLEA